MLRGKPVANVNLASCVKLDLHKLVLLIQRTTANPPNEIAACAIGSPADYII
jgi:hypothetical protein